MKPDAAVLAVVGSRTYGDDADVQYAMDAYLGGCYHVVSGGARGVDRAAEAWAAELGLSVVSYRPRKATGGVYVVSKFVDGHFDGDVTNPKTHSPFAFPDFRSAAFRRNWWIVRDADRVLALWDGDSTGTALAIAAACRLRKDLRIWMEGDS